MRYSVCTDTVFENYEILDAMEAVKKCGFDSFEFWFWWIRDLSKIVQKQQELGLECAAVCAKFERCSSNKAEQDEYIKDFKDSIAAADALHCKNIIVQAGWQIEGLSRQEQLENLKDTLRCIAPIAEEAGKTLILEPLNTKVDHEGYILSDTDESFAFVRELQLPNLKILFDIYHQQISSGNILDSIHINYDLIGHIHLAGCPGRHEPYRCELDYGYILKELEAAGYDKYIGFEYIPSLEPSASLLEMKHTYLDKEVA